MINIQELITDIENRYYRLECDECDNDWYGTRERYNKEMSNPDAQWTCGHCGNRDSSAFDDEYWEEQVNKLALYEYIKFLENRIAELEAK